MVAAVLHRDEGARAVLWGGGHIRRHVPGARIELCRIGDEAVDLGHGSKLVAFDIGGAAGHQQAGIWIGAARAADRLTGLPHCFARDRTTVNHDEVAFLRQHRADLLAFGNVESAAERDDLRFAHA